MSVLIKNIHSNLVTHINSSSPNIIWCRLHKSLLGLDSDIYLATVYSPPLQTQKKAGEDIISILDKEIQKYSAQGKIILLGDFQARTGTINDFIENDTHGPVLPNDMYHLLNTVLNEIITVNSLIATTSRKRPPPVSDHFTNNRFVSQSNTVSKTLS